MLFFKLRRQGRIEMQHLHGSILYACTPGSGTTVFDSRATNKEREAAFAARCSMSIPLFFKPQDVDGRNVYDGGMRHNFPVARFLADNPGQPFIALYLGEPLGFRKSKWLLAEVLDILLGGDELTIVDSHRESVAVINPKPISTLNFSLTATETEFLLKAGRAAAMRLVSNRLMDSAPTLAEVEATEDEVETLRGSLMMARALRRRKRFAWLLLFIFAMGMIVLLWKWIAGLFR